MVSFWIVAALMALGVTAVLLRAWTRGTGRDAQGATQDVALYREQLAEVERDLLRGVIPQAEAERVRLEVSRRLLAADTRVGSDHKTMRTGVPPIALRLGLGAVLIAGAMGLYWQIGAPGYGDLTLKNRVSMAEDRWKTRPTQAEAEAQAPPFKRDAEESYLKLLEQLRETVAKRPDDIQGQMLLARSEANVGNYADAARAQTRMIALKGDAVTVPELVDLGEMLIFAAGGFVSPEAEDVLGRILAIEPGNGPARYYRGLMMTQIGRPDLGFREWDALLRAGPPTASWIEPILVQIEPVAQMAGIRYDIPEIGNGSGMGMASAAAPGPTQDDVTAAQDMTPQARMEMIEGMVAGLSDRLATDGGTADEWARLISALGVLGQGTRAQAIYDNAVQVFSADNAALDMIDRAGEQAGVSMR